MPLKKWVFTSGVFTIVLMVYMMRHGTPLKTYPYSPKGIIDLERAGTPAKAFNIISAWQPNLVALARQQIYVDFLFLFSYGIFLYSLCLYVSKWYRGSWKNAGKWIGIAMLVAAFFDAVENILILKTLNGSLGKELVASTYMFASVKFLLVGFGILYVLFSLTGKIMRPKQMKINLIS